ncbi:elongation factor P lysine(34) lysyltransferase, partial [Gammaproteobacteria bacterium]|nr:elongation factor P lysine(34) lysyltransferase [Gammaproteobacteria bacterium]
AEQRTRFEADIAERARRGYDAVPLDEALLAALAAGMPECSGVALGVDRLVMAALGIDDIADVIAFPQTRR